jgi:hypothetical protein
MADKDEFTSALTSAYFSSSAPTFNTMQRFISAQLGRNLTTQERSLINKKLSSTFSHSKHVVMSDGDTSHVDSMKNNQAGICLRFDCKCVITYCIDSSIDCLHDGLLHWRCVLSREQSLCDQAGLRLPR